jgi:hypothetical protein
LQVALKFVFVFIEPHDHLQNILGKKE